MQKKAFSFRSYLIKGILFLYDLIALNVSYGVALWLRFFDDDVYISVGVNYMRMFKEFAPWYTVICLALFLIFRLYSGVWKYAGANDIRKLVLINIVTCLIYVCGSLLVVGRMPISVYALGAGLQFLLMVIVRIAPRYITDVYGLRSGGAGVIPLMIVGLGENARIIQGMIEKDRTNMVRPVCVIDYYNKYGTGSFNGLTVISKDAGLEKCIEKYNIGCAVIAERNLPEEYIKEIKKICADKGVEVRDFVIGSEVKRKGIRVKDLLKVTDGKVRIILSDGAESEFVKGSDALGMVGGNSTVIGLSVESDVTVIRISEEKSGQTQSHADWIDKYREETGYDISFF